VIVEAALKAEIQEILEIVKTVPETLQTRTLELLLQDALDRAGGRKHSLQSEQRRDDSGGEEGIQIEKKATKVKRESEGLDPNTMPMRVKAFMKRTKVTDKQLGSLFHIEGNQYEPIWGVNATKVSKAQVQIALMQSLQRALTKGEFSFDREEVREDCRKKGCYDRTNFKANFQNNGKYFSGLEKEGLVSLTDEGMTALAAVVSELAGASDGK
jgi:hypothetical protein